MDYNKSRQKKNKPDKERVLLEEYLNQYYTGRMKKVQLERRLKKIRQEMNEPIGGYGYSPVNYGGTNKTGAGAASFVYRISEIETRIENQKNQVEKALLKVMDVMDFLEENSTERMVLELRFIDCKNWTSIEKEMHLSRSSLFNYRNKGFKKLLEFKKVCQILREFKNEICNM